MLRPTAAAVILLLAGLHAGCASKEILRPTGMTTTVLPTDSRRGTLSTRLGLAIRLELPAPGPGHVWRIIQHDPRFLRPLSETDSPPAEAGRTAVAFHAIAAGRTQLKFLAVPSGDAGEVVPVDHYDVNVVIR